VPGAADQGGSTRASSPASPSSAQLLLARNAVKDKTATLTSSSSDWVLLLEEGW